MFAAIARELGQVAEAARLSGICSCADAPIVVDGELWGAMSTDSTDPAPLPDDIEDRLVEFTSLLGSAISSSASRETAPVGKRRHLGDDTSPAAAFEATAYFVIAESLTNVAKHAQASGATVVARVEDHGLRIEVRDDGIGGADARGGTLVTADIPLPG